MWKQNRRFVRRDWLAAQLDEKLREPGKRFVLLTAEPGAGKSVFNDHQNGCATLSAATSESVYFGR
jgi:hypothetical protein